MDPNLVNKVDLIANVVTIIGFTTIIIAISSYVRSGVEKNIEDYKRMKHYLSALRSQLNIIGTWSAFERGGYHRDEVESLAKDNINDWSNPFHQVFKVAGSGPLEQLPLFPESLKMGGEFMQALLGLNQEIVSFNSVLEELSLFKFSRNSDENVKLHMKLGGLRMPNGSAVIPADEDEEIRFETKLAELYAALHVYHIGDAEGNSLHAKHKFVISMLDKKEKEFYKSNYHLYRWVVPFWKNEYVKDEFKDTGE